MAEVQVQRMIVQDYKAILIRLMAKVEVAEVLASASAWNGGAGSINKVWYANVAARRAPEWHRGWG